MHLPKRYHSAYIIDGQHRLYGYSDTNYAQTNTIPVVAFINLNRTEQLKLFMDINENQKSVSKTLRVTLNSDMLWDSADLNEQRDALRSKIAQMCGEEPTSPLLGRVVIGEDEKNPAKCITIEAIQQALKRTSFLSTFGKNNVISSDGSFDLGKNDSTVNKLYPFIEGCLKVIKTNCENEWHAGEQGVLTINRGIQGIIRVINDIVEHLINQDKISPKSPGQSIQSMIDEVEYYLEPLISYFNTIEDSQRKELKGFLGGGADNKFWRSFQKVISQSRPDFNPDGLNEYLENETKVYNLESRDYLNAIRECVKDKISSELMEYYGENWLIKGISKTIYKRAENAASEKNYELMSNDEDGNFEIWDCITLADCKEIVVYSRNWSEIFEGVLTRPEDSGLSTKEQKTEWISILSKEINKISKPSYSVPKKTFEFISSIYKWLCVD